MLVRRTCLRLLLASVPGLLLLASHDAKAQSAGTTNTPLPNVMLLIDTSGSMERMPDNSMPSDDRVPGSTPATKITAAAKARVITTSGARRSKSENWN